MKQTEESTLHRGHWLSFALLDCSHKALFSLSTAFLLINLLFLFSQNLRIPFIRLEISIPDATASVRYLLGARVRG